MKHDTGQFSLFAHRGSVDQQRSAAPTTEQLRRMLHVSQVMQMNPSRPANHRYALARLEVWLRAMIKERA
jgi:hypothetical protein